MNVINKMIQEKIDLPDEFQLHYIILEHKYQYGTMLNINPHLTLESAKSKCGESNCSAEKYGNYTVVNSDTKNL